jgi:hypothetical protein
LTSWVNTAGFTCDDRHRGSPNHERSPVGIANHLRFRLR